MENNLKPNFKHVMDKYKVNKTSNGLSSSQCLDMLEDLSDLSETESLFFDSDSDDDSQPTFTVLQNAEYIAPVENIDNEGLSEIIPGDNDYDNNYDNEVFPSTSSSWNKTNNSMPHINEFSGNSGMKVPIPDSPLGFVKLFLTRELLDFFTSETNRYAEQRRRKNPNTYKGWVKATVGNIA